MMRDDYEGGTPEEAEAFFDNLPKAIRELREGRQRNYELASRAVRLTRMMQAMALIGILLLGYGAYRVDENTSDLSQSQAEDRDRATKICTDLTENAAKFNRLIDTLVTRTNDNPDLSAAEKDYFVRLYSSTKQTLPVCEPPLGLPEPE